MVKKGEDMGNLKRCIFFLLLACLGLIASDSVSAEATSLISGYYFTDDTFVLNDKIAIVDVNTYDQVIIDYDNTFIVVKNNTCKRVINNEFCVDSIIFDISKDRKKAQLKVYYVGPDISLTSGINGTAPIVGEGVKITAKIENKGNETAKNLTFIDLFPPEILVLDVKQGHAKIEKVLVFRNDTSSWQNMTRIFWQGDMLAGEIKDIVYTLKPTKKMDSKFTSRVKYSDGIKDREVVSSQISIKTASFFEITRIITPTDYSVSAGSEVLTSGETIADIEAGEEALFIAQIEDLALKNESINISYIDFHFSDGLIYKGPVSFIVYTNSSNANESYRPGIHTLKDIGKNTYRWQGMMNVDGLVFAIKFKGARKGTQRITLYAHLVQLDEKKDRYYRPLYEEDYASYDDVDVKLDDIILNSNLKDGQTFDAGEKAYFTLYAQNQNEYANFTIMRVYLDTPWDTRNYTIRNLKKTNYINLFDGFVDIPMVEGSTSYKITANVTYDTEYGETYSKKIERRISVKPHSPLQISHTFTPSKSQTIWKVVMGNEEVKVDLKFTNSAYQKIDHVNVTEVIDPVLNKEGNITRIINIDKGTTMYVLSYKIDPPDNRTAQNYSIKTFVDYAAGNETYHIIKDIAVEVNPKTLSINVKKSIQPDTVTMDVPFYVDYLVKNDAGEKVENITLIFPLTEEFDIIGNRYYSIKKLEKDEQINVVGEEKIRAKMNKSSVKLGLTRAVFHDAYGNRFEINSTQPTTEVLYRPFITPALKVSRNISTTEVNQSESFSVTTTVENIGRGKIKANISDLGKTWGLEIDEGKRKSFAHNVLQENAGEILLPPAVASYGYKGEACYAASNTNKIKVISAEKEEAKAAQQEAGGAVAPEETPPSARRMPYAKYVALAIFMAVICIIIFSVIRMKPREKRFDFLEE